MLTATTRPLQVERLEKTGLELNLERIKGMLANEREAYAKVAEEGRKTFEDLRRQKVPACMCCSAASRTAPSDGPAALAGLSQREGHYRPGRV